MIKLKKIILNNNTSSWNMQFCFCLWWKTVLWFKVYKKPELEYILLKNIYKIKGFFLDNHLFFVYIQYM